MPRTLRKRSNWWTLGKLALGLGLLILVIRFVDFRQVLRLFSRLGPGSVLVLFIIFLIDRLLMAYKWGLLLRGCGVRVGLGHLVTAYIYSNFAGSFMPASVGGDVVRFFAVVRRSVPAQALLASMIVEKLGGFLGMGVMASAAALVVSTRYARSDHALTVGVVVAGATLAVMLAVGLMARGTGRGLVERAGMRLLGRFGEKARALKWQIRDILRKTRTLIAFFLLTLLEQCLPVISLWVLAGGLGISAGFGPLACVVLIGLFLARIPVSISGIGVQEGVYVGLFVLMGMPAEEGLALSLGARLLDIVFPFAVIVLRFPDALRTVRRARIERLPGEGEVPSTGGQP